MGFELSGLMLNFNNCVYNMFITTITILAQSIVNFCRLSLFLKVELSMECLVQEV